MPILRPQPVAHITRSGEAIAGTDAAGGRTQVTYQLATVRLAVETPNPFLTFFVMLRATALREPVRSFLAAIVLGIIAFAPPLFVSIASDTVQTFGLRLPHTRRRVRGIGSRRRVRCSVRGRVR